MAKKTFKPLDELIDSTGLKKTAIAEKLNVDISTLYKWRVSPDTMSIDVMERLADVLNLEFYDIYEVAKKFRE
ncbi:hypothetical protein B8A39_06555 [Dolosigranulum pigrum]|jgi:phage repressor|uniref:helix-turn-helix domain-containing protein n=1 Tax=Dolosigranulum pigrum TaxID=29394 RepID=UPI000DBFF09D|nr:helix-turn-helix transcriptional regulator [Dolosigranulum pigrum]RAN51498.1 hypothetical protein B8A39_06555 [Dolosigranulum pigrum]